MPLAAPGVSSSRDKLRDGRDGLVSYKQTPSLKYVEGFESVSDIGNARAELVRRGYSAVDIAKIFGGNWMRVFREAWNA